MGKPQNGEKAGPPQKIAELVISIDAAGNVSVNGPIENRMLCYGLLEVARDVIVEFQEQQKSAIVTAPAGLANVLKMGKKN